MEYEPGVRAALDEVHAKGEADKVEHLIVLRDGNIVLNKDGESDHVGLTDEEMAMIEPGDVLVHNHPQSLNALSNMDLGLATNLKAAAIYAISDDKSVYKASAQPAVTPGMIMLGFEVELVSVADSVSNKIARSIPGFIGQVSESHWILQGLNAHNLIRYDYELADRTKAMVEKFDAGVAKERIEHPKDESDTAILWRALTTAFNRAKEGKAS